MVLDGYGVSVSGTDNTFFYLIRSEKYSSDIICGGLVVTFSSQNIYLSFQAVRQGKTISVILVIMAFVFNCLNGFVNGYGVFHIYNYENSWLYSWQFITGIIFFIAGFVINKTADEKLRKLRPHGAIEYLIPRGWLFSYISSPHFFGEIIEWAGWAIMTCSIPGTAFFIFTFANLFPRAVSTHKWFRMNFPDYPPERKAVIPFVI